MPPQQDISPTAPTDNRNTFPSLIESSATDKSTDPTDTDNKNEPSNDMYDNAYDSFDEYDDCAYDDEEDDTDDDDSYASSSSEEGYGYNLNVIIDMYGNKYTTTDNNVIVPCDEVDDYTPMTIQAAQRQINAILAGRTTTDSIKAFTNQAKREYDEFLSSPNKNADCTRSLTPTSLIPTYANDDHNAFLYHRWKNANKNKNTSTTCPSTTKPTPAAVNTSKTTAYTPIKIPIKDDPSITPTLETLCSLDTCFSCPT